MKLNKQLRKECEDCYFYIKIKYLDRFSKGEIIINLALYEKLKNKIKRLLKGCYYTEEIIDKWSA